MRYETLQEVADKTNLSLRTLQEWSRKGMKSFIQGGLTMTTTDWVDDYCEKLANQRAKEHMSKGGVKYVV